MIAINIVHQIGLQATMGRNPNRRKVQDIVQQLRLPAKRGETLIANSLRNGVATETTSKDGAKPQ